MVDRDEHPAQDRLELRRARSDSEPGPRAPSTPVRERTSPSFPMSTTSRNGIGSFESFAAWAAALGSRHRSMPSVDPPA
jgi:hypothetical protein